MSYVTKLTLVCPDRVEADSGVVGQIQEWFSSETKGNCCFEEVSVGLWHASSDRFYDMEGFLGFTKGLKWDDPANVVMIIRREEGSTQVLRWT